MATIKDVARDANVSIATVSKVINNKGKISDETCRRVLDSMKKVGYQRHAVSGGRKEAGSLSVGLIIPSITNPYHSILARNIELVLSAAGYMMYLCTSDRNERSELDAVKKLVARGVDGVVVLGPSMMTLDWVHTHSHQDTAFMFIEGPLCGNNSNYMRINNYDGMQEAVKYIVSLKHRRIAYITGPLNRTCNQERLRAFRDTLGKLGIPVMEEFILESSFEYEGGYNLTWQLLKHPTPPTTIFTGNDIMAFGAINCIVDQGLRVPDDISVIGFDDIPQASYFIPSLTTVRQPIAELGKISAEYIINKLSGKELGKIYSIPTSLVIRRSTAFCTEP